MKEFLARIKHFWGLTPEMLALLEPEAQGRTFTRGSKLYVQGGPHPAMYAIVGGRVRTEQRHPDIREPIVLAEYGPGEVVGECGVLEGAPCTHSAIATEQTETIELPAVCLARLLAQSPEVSSRFRDAFSTRMGVEDGGAVPRHTPVQDR